MSLLTTNMTQDADLLIRLAIVEPTNNYRYFARSIIKIFHSILNSIQLLFGTDWYTAALILLGKRLDSICIVRSLTRARSWRGINRERVVRPGLLGPRAGPIAPRTWHKTRKRRH